MADRCFGDGDALYERYHDLEWGRPVVTEQGLFERICLEAFQSGLSWRVVLGKRSGMRRAFAGFEVDELARFGEDDILRLLGDREVIRNRHKIEAAIANAGAAIVLRRDGGLSQVMWSHASAQESPPTAGSDIPSATDGSKALATRLKGAGFSFVGPTTIYAAMQACGIVNDHLVNCPVRAEVAKDRTKAIKEMGLAPN
jgi:DNA-3-methyladenine glycosylase I